MSISTTTALKYFNFAHMVRFPSFKANLVLIAMIGALGGGVFLPRLSFSDLLVAVLLGLGIFSASTILADVATWTLYFRKDRLLTLRRILALSMVCLSCWITSAFVLRISIGGITLASSLAVGSLVAVPVRVLTVDSLSSAGSISSAFALTQPLAVLVLLFANGFISLSHFAVATLISAFLAMTLVKTLVFILKKRGTSSMGHSPMELFRAYMMGWLGGDDRQLEILFETLGVRREINLLLLMFRPISEPGRAKALIALGDFHPGPFRTVGSSSLPFAIQNALSSKTGAVVLVPHSPSEHDRNVVSVEECGKIINAFEELLENGSFSPLGSRPVRTFSRKATAMSQTLGQGILLVLSAMETSMEDVKIDVKRQLTDTTSRTVAVMDAHNSISDRDRPEDLSQDLVSCGREAVETSARESLTAFRIGASSKNISSYNPRDGLGPGGVCTIVVETAETRTAYVTLDGNNMVLGLRDKIRESIRRAGISECEVMTTDTHIVNGLIPAPLGYHPIGQAIPGDEVISWIQESVADALENLEECEIAVNTSKVTVKTFGSSSIDSMLSYVKRAAPLVISALVIGTSGLVILAYTLMRG